MENMDTKDTGAKKRYSVFSSELPADLETPVSAYLKLREIGASFLLESAEGVDRLGRFSFIGFTSNHRLKAQANKVIYQYGDSSHEENSDPLESVKKVVESIEFVSEEPVPALLGAAVGFIGYDYAKLIEEIPSRRKASGTPICQFYFAEALVAFDHLSRKMKIYSMVPEGIPEAGELHEKIKNKLRAPLVYNTETPGRDKIEFTSDTSPEEYREMVDIAKKHIYDGDCFQIVLSRKVSTYRKLDSFELYRRLRMGNPSPYMFYLDFDNLIIVGSSPEVMVKAQNGKAIISPIAGTRPRGDSLSADEALAKDLLADEKERAEHTMLVDLARNDLGRVCKYGTVSVQGFMRIEKYSHVMHIVSDVEGELREDADQFDLFRASFPAGTVTGAPKVRAMEIIEELEKSERGVYAGAVGYFSPSGDMDTCIAIRTIVIEGERIMLQAGAGIVADSRPENEHVETENKIAALKVAVKATAGGVL